MLYRLGIVRFDLPFRESIYVRFPYEDGMDATFEKKEMDGILIIFRLIWKISFDAFFSFRLYLDLAC